MIGADYVTPKLDLALEQRAGCLGRFLIVRVKIHAAVVKRLAQLGVGEFEAVFKDQLLAERQGRARSTTMKPLIGFLRDKDYRLFHLPTRFQEQMIVAK